MPPVEADLAGEIEALPGEADGKLRMPGTPLDVCERAERNRLAEPVVVTPLHCEALRRERPCLLVVAAERRRHDLVVEHVCRTELVPHCAVQREALVVDSRTLLELTDDEDNAA